jgi:hypothetical protein
VKSGEIIGLSESLDRRLAPGEIAAEKQVGDRAWSGAAIEEARLRVCLGGRQFGSRYTQAASLCDDKAQGLRA